MAGLRTQAEIALREHADPQQLIRSLEWIMASSERLAHLIDQLLMLARIEPGAKVAIDLCPLDLDKLARDVTMEWVPRALEKDIDLGFESKGMPVSVAGDAALLQEMLRNLIDNAIRYTPPHGRVTVGIEQQDDNRVSLYVEDDGPGIPPDQRERVFERFYRILGSGEDGCGLGLSIVREIAEHHHGTVSIDGGARRGANSPYACQRLLQSSRRDRRSTSIEVIQSRALKVLTTGTRLHSMLPRIWRQSMFLKQLVL